MANISQLNEIQRRALELVSDGTSASKDISRILNRSPGTIDVYLSQAAALLGVSSRHEAARKYRELASLESEFRTSALAESPATPPYEQAEHMSAGRSRHTGNVLFPPIGGPSDDLTASKALQLIIQLAIMAGAATAIIVVIYFWVMEQFAELSR